MLLMALKYFGVNNFVVFFILLVLVVVPVLPNKGAENCLVTETADFWRNPRNTVSLSQNDWSLSNFETVSNIVFSDTCNIERKGKISHVDFLENYAFKQPVILTNVSDNSEFRKLCLKHNLLRDYGQKIVTLSTANTHSYDKVQMTFQEYVERVLTSQDESKSGQETLYFFGNHDYSEWDELFKHYVLPPYELPSKSPALSFGIAGAGTGVPFHFHGPGFAEVIHGRKRWFLLPYENKPYFDPDKTTLLWLLEDYHHVNASEKIYECVLKPGEILYFPDKWWHATLNVEASVFMSTFLG